MQAVRRNSWRGLNVYHRVPFFCAKFGSDGPLVHVVSAFPEATKGRFLGFRLMSICGSYLVLAYRRPSLFSHAATIEAEIFYTPCDMLNDHCPGVPSSITFCVVVFLSSFSSEDDMLGLAGGFQVKAFKSSLYLTPFKNICRLWGLKTLNLTSNYEDSKMDHDETGCQAPGGPILCINNCGFFGSAATMNMCSKCHKDMLLKQEQAKLAASSIEKIVNCGSSGKDPVIPGNADISVPSVEANIIPIQPPDASVSSKCGEMKVKEGPNRCSTCRKRVGLTGFNCRCGNLFCAMHRYSDKHNCPFDYRTAGRDCIAKANPLVKADKLDKI